MKRKRIGLITICPEKEYPQRVMKGVFSQCEKYGYDVVVISALSSICTKNEEYLAGELSIYELINFDLFDGFIVTPIPMTEDRIQFLYDRLLKMFQTRCTKPVVSIDYAFGDYPTVYTDDESAFFYITEHLIQKHNCKEINVLGGLKEVPLSNARVAGIKKAMKKYNLSLNEDNIFPGDFWYYSGEALAERYINKELPLPDAVICLSDYMAIGLVNRLIQNGIKIPEDVIVTGYEAVFEAAINNPPITTYAADQEHTGALAVNYLHSQIDPDGKVIKADKASENNLCIGLTCGCSENAEYTRGYYQSKQYVVQDYNKQNLWKSVNMAMFLESYMSERLTACESPEESLGKIYESKYLLKPYRGFYVCLNEDWLKTDTRHEYFSKKMNLAISAEVDSKLHGWNNHVFIGKGREKLFDKSEMLPAFSNKEKSPQLYYFAPIHFSKYTLGYAVLQNDLSSCRMIDEVYRNYIRNINNAIEMSRAKYEVAYLSEHDPMTDLLNRRGMERLLKSKIKEAKDDDKLFAIVIDMDGLKRRNDLYGHAEGDKGIIAISEAVSAITKVTEICVRGGGDEFYILGVGKYTDNAIKEKLSKFVYYLETKNELMSIPASASFGYAIGMAKSDEGYNLILEKADSNMYKNKREKKAARDD